MALVEKRLLTARMIRLAFWAAVAFTIVMATLPSPPQIPGSPPDKIQHIAAFAILSVLGAFGYRETPMWRIAIGLSSFGAVIEIIQGIPAIHRDADIKDWIADSVAVAVVLTGLNIWRKGIAKRHQQSN